MVDDWDDDSVEWLVVGSVAKKELVMAAWTVNVRAAGLDFLLVNLSAERMVELKAEQKVV